MYHLHTHTFHSISGWWVETYINLWSLWFLLEYIALSKFLMTNRWLTERIQYEQINKDTSKFLVYIKQYTMFFMYSCIYATCVKGKTGPFFLMGYNKLLLMLLMRLSDENKSTLINRYFQGY